MYRLRGNSDLCFSELVCSVLRVRRLPPVLRRPDPMTFGYDVLLIL